MPSTRHSSRTRSLFILYLLIIPRPCDSVTEEPTSMQDTW
ncbi:hypothetical protein trd_A0013 (plasmid) [Thermomicrobium roseum DSM 5159]|uniref:Uncharacterized protein n=1 Tax=Thermomicrobium roseum (strain ATCC 27502 / DSM 5159 / P-2) TaxID=309801 RepID=B9L586_THERP|nr:hypothetical protein trd_A0013 [Thermomicrobium roseum DSM 5159]